MRWIWLLAALPMSGSAWAQDAADLQRCVAIQADGARLSCYDAALKRTPGSPAPSTAGKWIFEEKTDPLDGEKSTFAMLVSPPPHGEKAVIFLRCIKGAVDGLVTWPAYLGHEKKIDVRWRVGDGSIMVESWDRASGGNAAYVAGLIRFVRELETGAVLYLNLTPQHMLGETIIFDITGTAAAAQRIQDTCPAVPLRPPQR